MDRRRHRGPKKMLTQAYVRKLFSYSKKTGLLRRRLHRGNRAMPGSIVGTSDGHKGYLRVGIDGKNWSVTHIIWLYVTGEWPKRVDHRDLNKTNNRWKNLRKATNSQNMCNTKVRSDSSTGVKGVYQDRRTGRYRVHVGLGRQRFYGGFFATVAEAKVARDMLAKKLHGKFFRE
jgi:hypothetical protein